MNLKQLLLRVYFRSIPKILRSRRIILGIETSCDDTACAIVDSERNILGECVKSYPEELFRLGGILPPVAKQWHERSIEEVVQTTLQRANLNMNKIDAVAVTTKPGMVLSLLVGLNYGKKLSIEHNKPLIPIHHMEAHALTARLFDKEIKYPFLTLLISGGHCLIAVVTSIDEFIILGKNLDDAPGQVLDKVARRLKLHNLPKYRLTAGGAAIEDIAVAGNTSAFEYTSPFNRSPHCNFSFSGFKSRAMKNIASEEAKYEIEGDQVLPNVSDFCASFQYCLVRHIVRQLQRAMEFIDLQNMIPANRRYLVISGGAACNSYFRKTFHLLCHEKHYKLCVPPIKYCSDNGVMIAWNGIEKYNEGIDILSSREIDSVRVESKFLFGKDISQEVAKMKIKCQWISLNEIQNIPNDSRTEVHKYECEENQCDDEGEEHQTKEKFLQ